MDDRVWKNISIVLGVVCALLIGVAGALMIVGHRGGTADASTPPSGLVSETGLPGDSTSPDGSPRVTPTPAPTATPGPPAPATIAFTGLGLDAANDKNGTSRTFTIVSDGAGPVVLAVTKITGGGTARMCADVDSQGAHCKDSKAGALYTFNFKSDPTPNTWVVSFFGYGSSKPTIDVSFTWTTSSPKITISHGRFQGSSTSGIPELLNGFTASFKPRQNGALSVQAAWTVTADASLTLLDATSPPSVTVDTRQYKAATYVTPTFTTNVDPTKTYQVELRDLSADSGRPELTAQISFP